LISLIKSSLEWFGYDKNLGVETNEKFEKALEMQLEGSKTSEIAVALGFSKNNVRKVHAILAMPGGN
jgi:hypothetical protein